MSTWLTNKFIKLKRCINQSYFNEKWAHGEGGGADEFASSIVKSITVVCSPSSLPLQPSS
jgi:hypothetical protein